MSDDSLILPWMLFMTVLGFSMLFAMGGFPGLYLFLSFAWLALVSVVAVVILCSLVYGCVHAFISWIK